VGAEKPLFGDSAGREYDALRHGELYDTAGDMDFDDMYTFVPQIDILASLHEKGTKRMFMN